MQRLAKKFKFLLVIASSLMGKSNTLQYKPERQDGGSLTRGGLDAHDNHVPLAGTGATSLFSY